jgi:hypothetical protein
MSWAKSGYGQGSRADVRRGVSLAENKLVFYVKLRQNKPHVASPEPIEVRLPHVHGHCFEATAASGRSQRSRDQ